MQQLCCILLPKNATVNETMSFINSKVCTQNSTIHHFRPVLQWFRVLIIFRKVQAKKSYVPCVKKCCISHLLCVYVKNGLYFQK